MIQGKSVDEFCDRLAMSSQACGLPSAACIPEGCAHFYVLTFGLDNSPTVSEIIKRIGVAVKRMSNARGDLGRIYVLDCVGSGHGPVRLSTLHGRVYGELRLVACHDGDPCEEDIDG